MVADQSSRTVRWAPIIRDHPAQHGNETAGGPALSAGAIGNWLAAEGERTSARKGSLPMALMRGVARGEWAKLRERLPADVAKAPRDRLFAWASQHPYVIYWARGPYRRRWLKLILAISSRNTGLALRRVETCAALWVASSNHCDMFTNV